MSSESVRKAVISSSVFLTLIGMGLSIASVLTPSWQVVNLREYNSIHEHGLWLDCTRHTRDGNVLLRRYSTITEPLHCVYKFDYDKYSGTFDLEDDNSPVGEVNRHKFYGWHTATLILLGLALITSFATIMIGACGCRYPALSLMFAGSTLLTMILSSVAESLFFFFSHRADNRFIKGIVGTYEQRVGLAFFLQMGACFFHFIAFLVAMLATYFAFTGKNVELDRAERFSMPTSSKTNMTNVGRLGATSAAATFLRRKRDGQDPALAPLLIRDGIPSSLGGSKHDLGAAAAVANCGGPWRGDADSTTIGAADSLSQIVVGPGTTSGEAPQPIFGAPGVWQRQQQTTFSATSEFEHPVFVQQPTGRPSPARAGPYYRGDFERAVADSMPELPGGGVGTRSPYLHAEAPMRVRRKSETCV